MSGNGEVCPDDRPSDTFQPFAAATLTISLPALSPNIDFHRSSPRLNRQSTLKFPGHRENVGLQSMESTIVPKSIYRALSAAIIGVICSGFSSSAYGTRFGFLSQDGSFSTLVVPGATGDELALALGINDRDEIVGRYSSGSR